MFLKTKVIFIAADCPVMDRAFNYKPPERETVAVSYAENGGGWKSVDDFRQGIIRNNSRFNYTEIDNGIVEEEINFGAYGIKIRKEMTLVEAVDEPVYSKW